MAEKTFDKEKAKARMDTMHNIMNSNMSEDMKALCIMQAIIADVGEIKVCTYEELERDVLSTKEYKEFEKEYQPKNQRK